MWSLRGRYIIGVSATRVVLIEVQTHTITKVQLFGLHNSLSQVMNLFNRYLISPKYNCMGVVHSLIKRSENLIANGLLLYYHSHSILLFNLKHLLLHFNANYSNYSNTGSHLIEEEGELVFGNFKSILFPEPIQQVQFFNENTLLVLSSHTKLSILTL